MKKIGWLIYNREDAEKNKAYIDWMLGEAEKLGHGASVLLSRRSPNRTS